MEIIDRFEASLTEEGRCRLLVDAITDYATYMLDSSGVITSWNPGAERIKGYRASEILREHFSIFDTHEDQRDGLPNLALQVAARGGKFESQGWRIRKDGSRFWANVVIDPIRKREGELVGFAKITRDLNERRLAEDAVKRSEEQFRLLVWSVTDYAIYLLDPQGHVSSWNLGAERIEG
jgi:PAS domain S-box-containing protein